MKNILAGADAGGTFTDFIALDPLSGDLKVGKTLSQPNDPAAAIADAALRANVDIAGIEALVYGTTVATNALLERNGAKVGLLATLGFRDLLAIQRVTRLDHFDLHWQKTKSLVPRLLRRGVRERVLYDGSVETPLDEQQLRVEIQFLLDNNVESIAVAYLFSYMNPRHEQRTRKIIKDMAPEMYVSLSSDVLPKCGEFTRTSTTVIDAHLKPLLHSYLHKLDNQCSSAGVEKLLIMQSNGGASMALTAAEVPARLVKSGPAGGVIAASYIGKLTGQKHVIIADMGGTSFEAGFMPDCEPAFTTREELEFGVPIALNMIDVRAIGAGGGSLAYVDDAGMLKVGPRSAGSFPGPACYDRGGTEPTITDANVVLGRMVKEFPLGGHLSLSVDLARKALQPIADKMSMTVERVARGIVEIAVNNMAQAMRLVSIDRGHDPRLATLIPYGGAGPLHACELARALQINTILVPRFPGAFSALGALISETRFDYRRTFLMNSKELHIEKAAEIFVALERNALDDLKREGFAAEPILQRSVEVRYVGQNFELEVEIADGPVTAESFAAAAERFHGEHQRLYGYALPKEEWEVLNLNVTAKASHKPVNVSTVAPGGVAAPIGQARVYFSGYEETVETNLYDRTTLGAGTEIEGPAIIGQLDTTTLLEPNAKAVVDEFGNMLISFKEKDIA